MKSENQEVLLVSSYPPRACGIASYSMDLAKAINDLICNMSVKICALNDEETQEAYPSEVKYIINTSLAHQYYLLAEKINSDTAIGLVFIQHEFGLFGGDYGEFLLYLLYNLTKPILVTFHTVLPNPDEKRRRIVKTIAEQSEKVIVMTQNSRQILESDYELDQKKINVIPHGIHPVPWKDKKDLNKQILKEIEGPNNRLILTTFGLLSSNKNIETALDALPKIIEHFPNLIYLIVGKTHPVVKRNEGEKYRTLLQEKVRKLSLEEHVAFIDKYVELPELLKILAATDLYLFTSKNPFQAVSGTFAYAMGSSCPIISTPIPHALELLDGNCGHIVDFENSEQLAQAAIHLLENENLRIQLGHNSFRQSRSWAWHNSAVKHSTLFEEHLNSIKLRLPKINLKHILDLTDKKGIIQFSKIHQPDIKSGYTLDDNARALIAFCMLYEKTKDSEYLSLIYRYANFLKTCQQPDGTFLNYVDHNNNFHEQNNHVNLEDSNGRAIWALGFVISLQSILPLKLISQVRICFQNALPESIKMESPRSVAFAIKGLYYGNKNNSQNKTFIALLANKLLAYYNAVADINWRWFEEYLTYANSTLPEAMLYAYLATGNPSYKLIAHMSFEFLLDQIFQDGKIKVISNNGWQNKGRTPREHGEQPIDVAYTIEALSLFHAVFKDDNYKQKMEIAFAWFLGKNHLQEMIYDPVTGGCQDGLEEKNVNLNQGAESAICYLMARLIIEKSRSRIMKKPLRLTEGKESRPASREHPKTIYVKKKTPDLARLVGEE